MFFGILSIPSIRSSVQPNASILHRSTAPMDDLSCLLFCRETPGKSRQCRNSTAMSLLESGSGVRGILPVTTSFVVACPCVCGLPASPHATALVYKLQLGKGSCSEKGQHLQHCPHITFWCECGVLRIVYSKRRCSLASGRRPKANGSELNTYTFSCQPQTTLE